ncbi:MAG: hypothetical protein U9R19_17900, partial [Bacteroidota bacterium]|nr:hypothetical protein [Bacteroidota bacterium]
LKTASVIGRNFYYKVLEEAANTIGELDDRLQYLKEVQLIGESKKKEEIEYLFKHALAQQATYESIIQNSKKELHLKIARSIEKVFAENIHEFYGTLAYHYELAENREKTLDFLVKAGNEAMNSGGSADGINFYNKALKLYLLLNKKTDDVDLLKSIYLSLGKAYHSRGMANEAVEVLDKALLLFGFKFPKSKIRLMAGFIYNLIYYVFAVYNDKYFFNKSNDTDRDQLFEVIFHRGRTVSSISSKRFIVEGFYSTKPLFSTDLSKNSNAFAVFVGFSAGFFWTGISLKTSSRIFKVSERFVNEKNTHAYQVFRYSQKMNNYHCGILKTDGDLDFLFDFCMKKGFFFEAAYILFYNGFCYGDKGNRQKCQEITANLLLVADQFESKQMMSMYYRFIAFTSLRYREFNISIIEKIKEGIELMRKTEHNVLLADLCSRLCTLYLFHGNIASAQTYLDEASMHLKTFKSAKPFYVSYLMAKTRYQLEQLKSEKTINSGQKKKLREIIKELIKTAMKFRGTLPEALLLKAEVYQYLLNYKVCFNALKAAQQFAEKSEAKVELSRVYFELGKFLSNPKTKQKQLNGLSGKDYLEKAKSLFEEMNLQWDLEEFKSFYHTSQNDTAR